MIGEITRMSLDDEELPDADAFAPQPGARAFAPAEMRACPLCQRANAPTRMACLYCGAPLPGAHGADDLQLPTLRPLETWEQGYNIVLLPRAEAAADLPREVIGEAARVLRLEPTQLAGIITARVPLPLARTAQLEEVALIERRLMQLGLSVETVADETLAVERQPPQRMRRFEFRTEGLTAWANAETAGQHSAWADVTLLVAGRLSRRQIEVEERRGLRKTGEVVDTREFSDDERVLDIYLTEHAGHWRIRAEGFDYTCLGAQKSLLAVENFSRLLATLRTRATAVVLDDSYMSLRHLLQTAWPVAEQTSSGLRRDRPGRLHTEAITTVSNETQFTRYSRLRRHFVLRANTHR